MTKCRINRRGSRDGTRAGVAGDVWVGAESDCLRGVGTEGLSTWFRLKQPRAASPTELVCPGRSPRQTRSTASGLSRDASISDPLTFDGGDAPDTCWEAFAASGRGLRRPHPEPLGADSYRSDLCQHSTLPRYVADPKAHRIGHDPGMSTRPRPVTRAHRGRLAPWKPRSQHHWFHGAGRPRVPSAEKGRPCWGRSFAAV
jgi:hypothetical protein